MVADLGQADTDKCRYAAPGCAPRRRLSSACCNAAATAVRHPDASRRSVSIATKLGCNGREIALRDLDLADGNLSCLIGVASSFRQCDEMLRGQAPAGVSARAWRSPPSVAPAASSVPLLGVLCFEACDLSLDGIDARLSRFEPRSAVKLIVELGSVHHPRRHGRFLDGDVLDGAVDLGRYGGSVSLDVGRCRCWVLATAEVPRRPGARRSAPGWGRIHRRSGRQRLRRGAADGSQWP